MEQPARHSSDTIQQRIADYACDLTFERLSPDAMRAAKVRIIDTLGPLIGGFFAEPCRISRTLAARVPNPGGATVIGTRLKVTPDMAAFVNGTTARYLDFNDVYQWPGSFGGHPSDIVTPVLAVAEYVHASAVEFITGIVLAYEIYLRISDRFHNFGFDHTHIACLSSAVAAAKLLGLDRKQIAHCVAMAVTPNNALKVTRMGQKSMFKATATGQAGRAGVFAALLAQAGMEGPRMPFAGKSGWLEHVALERFTLDTWGGNDAPFKISDTGIKLRPTASYAIPAIMAAEKIAPLKDLSGVTRISVEVNKRTKDNLGTGEHNWNPASRETADHSVPYLVAATLMDGGVSLATFDSAHLGSAALRALMQKIEVSENQAFTEAFRRLPIEQRARITVVMANGEHLVEESSNDQDDLSAPKTDAQISQKFFGLTAAYFGTKRTHAILDRFWKLEQLKDIATIMPDFVLE